MPRLAEGGQGFLLLEKRDGIVVGFPAHGLNLDRKKVHVPPL
jgi:hypothetical protein